MLVVRLCGRDSHLPLEDRSRPSRIVRCTQPRKKRRDTPSSRGRIGQIVARPSLSPSLLLFLHSQPLSTVVHHVSRLLLHPRLHRESFFAFDSIPLAMPPLISNSPSIATSTMAPRPDRSRRSAAFAPVRERSWQRHSFAELMQKNLFHHRLLQTFPSPRVTTTRPRLSSSSPSERSSAC